MNISKEIVKKQSAGAGPSKGLGRTTTSYTIELRVYNIVQRWEIPYTWPDEYFTDNRLDSGYHVINFKGSEKELDEFSDWVYSHPDLKIIGIHIQ
jgi:hypothetical protein